MAIITLLTDFGIADSYVAEIKAVLLAGAPQANLVDISHQIPPGDVQAGQYLLNRSWKRFPDGQIHLSGVDPRVGSERRAMPAQSGGALLLAPPNAAPCFLSTTPRG